VLSKLEWPSRPAAVLSQHPTSSHPHDIRPVPRSCRVESTPQSWGVAFAKFKASASTADGSVRSTAAALKPNLQHGGLTHNLDPCHIMSPPKFSHFPSSSWLPKLSAKLPAFHLCLGLPRPIALIHNCSWMLLACFQCLCHSHSQRAN